MPLSLSQRVKQKLFRRLYTPAGNEIVTVRTDTIATSGGSYIEEKLVVESTGEVVYWEKVSQRAKKVLVDKKSSRYDEYMRFNGRESHR